MLQADPMADLPRGQGSDLEPPESLPALIPVVLNGYAKISYCPGAGRVLAWSSPMGLCLQKPLLVHGSAAAAPGNIDGVKINP